MTVKLDELPNETRMALEHLIIIAGRERVSEILSAQDTTSDNVLEKLKASFPTQYETASVNLDRTISTIGYFDKNWKTFYSTDPELKPYWYDTPSKYFPKDENAKVLDLGCGPGGTLKYFSGRGYEAIGLDGSKEMVRLAQETAPQCQVFLSPLISLPFEDNTFDFVWAQASLIHVPYEETEYVFKNIHRILKDKGGFYASYKHGARAVEVEPRWFYLMNEERLKPSLEKYFNILNLWYGDDTSKTHPSVDTKWLCFVAERKDVEDSSSSLSSSSATQQSKASSSSSEQSTVKKQDTSGSSTTQSDSSAAKEDDDGSSAPQTQNNNAHKHQNNAEDASFVHEHKHAGLSMLSELLRNLEEKLKDCGNLLPDVADFVRKQIECLIEILKENFESDGVSLYKLPDKPFVDINEEKAKSDAITEPPLSSDITKADTLLDLPLMLPPMKGKAMPGEGYGLSGCESSASLSSW